MYLAPADDLPLVPMIAEDDHPLRSLGTMTPRSLGEMIRRVRSKPIPHR